MTQSKISFDGRVAVVTGAGAGLGRLYALALGSRGCSVVVNDLGSSVHGKSSSRGPADAVVAEIRAAGGQAVASYETVATAQGADRIMDLAISAFGGLDILVNNAGTLNMAPLEQQETEDIASQVGVHLLGSLYCCSAAIPRMRKRNFGRIVLTSSGSGLSGFATQAPYGAAKTGMVGLMYCLARELDPKTIRINTIVPTAVTRMSDGLLWPRMEKFLKPELVVPAVVWLASENCTVNGEMFAAGGGYFSRLEVHRAPGVQLDPRLEATPEVFEANLARIMEMTGAEKFNGTQAAMEKLLGSMHID